MPDSKQTVSPIQLFQSLTIEANVPGLPKQMITTNTNEKAKDAIIKLVDSHIHSLPVYESISNRFVGLIDIIDMVQLLVTLHATSYRYATQWVEFDKATVESVMDLVKKNKKDVSITSINKKESLAEAVKKLAVIGIHRVIVLGDKNEAVNIITQATILNVLYSNLDKLNESFLHRKVRAFKGVIETKQIIKVNQVAKAIEAFRFLFDEKVAAVPIVDDEDKLLATISHHDIRHAALENDFPKSLYTLNSLEFAKNVHSREDTKLVSSLAVSCLMTETMEAVLKKLYKNKIHRLWIVNEEGKLLGAVSLRDIMYEILTEA